MHRAGIDVKMIECDVRIILRNASHCLPPELRSFQYVGFIDRGYFASPFPRGFKGDLCYALDLFDRIAHRVVGDSRSVCSCDTARFAKVQTTEQLAHNENVSATSD